MNLKEITFFDIDDTLFEGEVKVLVKDSITHAVLDELTPADYNNYKDNSKEYLDFSQFTCTDTFIRTSTPMTKTIKILQDFYEIAKNSDSEVYLLTARSDFDKKEQFLEFLIKHGIEAGHKDEQKVHVFRAGNLPGLDNAGKKYHIIKKILEGSDFETVRLYDDSEANLEAFLELKLDYPDMNVEAYLVNGSEIKEFVSSF